MARVAVFSYQESADNKSGGTEDSVSRPCLTLLAIEHPVVDWRSNFVPVVLLEKMRYPRAEALPMDRSDPIKVHDSACASLRLFTAGDHPVDFRQKGRKINLFEQRLRRYESN